MANDRETHFAGGYTPGFLAFKHGISIQDANDLIYFIGQDREDLDKAAASLKRSASRTQQ